MVRSNISKSLALSIVMCTGMIGFAIPNSTVPAHAASLNAVTVDLPPISTLDPSQNGVEILLDQGVILEGLYGYNQHNQLVPKIATGYKVSDGGLVWTFYLRHNAKWSNGQPVTAQDFYYSWMRLIAPTDSTGAIWQSAMTYVKNEFQYHEGQVKANQVGLKVINPYELQLTLTAPHNILGEMAIAGSMPLNPTDVNAHPGDWYMPQYFVGNGPYVVSSFTPNGNIVLNRNSNYVGNSSQYNVGNVQQIKVIPAPTVPVEDFMSGSLDVANVTSPSDYKYILGSPTLKAQLHKQPAYQVTTLEWDKSVDPSPLDNLLVRQAIAMAINRTPLATSVLNGLGGVDTVFGPKGWAPTKLEKGMPYNVAKARQLLAKAGYTGGKGIPTLYLYTKTQASNPTQVPMAEAIAQELKQELGINFKIDPVVDSVLNNIVYNGLQQGVHPGYVIGGGNAGWIDSTYLPLQANQDVHYSGVLEPAAFRSYAQDWYFQTYDARDVKLFGNPNDNSMGLKWSQWVPLQNAAQKDIAYLNSWTKKQPLWYQQMKKPLPGNSNTDIWNNLVAQWKAAKTPTIKHQLWVSAWTMVGSGSLGNGNAEYGLNAQVYTDEHETPVIHQLRLDEDQLQISTNAQQENSLAANIANMIMQQGYIEPLVYSFNTYLVRSNITDVVSNPFGWTWWNGLQYMQMKN